MPEPLTIVTSTAGLIGFAVSFRNIAFTIIDDIDNVKRSEEHNNPIAIRIALVFDKLYIWRRLWKVYDGMPSELFDQFWSESGKEEILSLLTQLLYKGDELYNQFHSQFTKTGKTATQANQNSASETLQDYTAEEMAADVAQFHKIRKRKKLLFRRVWQSLFTRPIFEKHLGELEAWTTLLAERAEKRFIAYNVEDNNVDWKDRLALVTFSNILRGITDRHTETSAVLRNTLQDTGLYSLDLHLDHRVEPVERWKVLEKAARTASLRYNFSVVKPQSDGEAHADFMCELATETLEAQNAHPEPHRSLSTIAESLFNWGGSGTPSNLRLQMSNESSAFVVQKMDDPVSDKENKQVDCLRTFMASHRTEYERGLQGAFKREERHRLAYELAEWALIFLQTQWFTSLCSCCIYRTETDDLRTTFKTRVLKVKHKDSDIGQDTHAKQWCQEELLDMHILRLGILLTEIALGFPILDLAFDPEQNRIEIEDRTEDRIEDRSTSRQGRRSRYLYRYDINKKVQKVMGLDYQQAVNHCLKHSTIPTEIGSIDLNKFYEKVVEPLFLHYEELSIKEPARRQNHRGAKSSRFPN